MAGKSRFTRLDAFAKTVEDARIRTRSGGVVTIAALLIVIYLVWGEWKDYRRVVVQPELIVDKGRGGYHVSMDVMAGELTSNYRREDGNPPEHDLSKPPL